MSKHYTNCFVERAQENLLDLELIGLSGSIGDPAPTPSHGVKDIKALGIRGIYIDGLDEDSRDGKTIVNEAWDAYLKSGELIDG